jgi:MFS family permease
MSKAVGSRDVNVKDVAEGSEINRLLKLDKVPWYKKKNLRMLYLTLVPSALGVEMASGYDGSVLNGLQAVDPWQEYFNSPNGALLGVLSSAFNIGAVIALPIVPYCNDRWGRKFCVLFGSILSAIGAILQGASQNCKWIHPMECDVG